MTSRWLRGAISRLSSRSIGACEGAVLSLCGVERAVLSPCGTERASEPGDSG